MTVLAAACLALWTAAAPPASKSKLPTETVLATFRVRENREEEFLAVLARAWSAYRRLGLVMERPHLVLRGTDADHKTYFVEVLTWRDSDAPDNAPPEVRAIWANLEELCEPRLGHRGIEFPEVEVVNVGSAPPRRP